MGIYAIGDIHGEIDKLKALIDTISPTNGDRLIFLGDYIDRGTESRRVVEYLIQLRADVDCVFLMGNHEHMLQDYLKGGAHYQPESWRLNGGIDTLDSYRRERDLAEMPIPDEHIEFLTNLPYYHTEPGFMFVHAGLKPNTAIDQNTFKHFLWLETAFTQSRYNWPEGIVVWSHASNTAASGR